MTKANLFTASGVLATILVAGAGWVFKISERTVSNEQSIKALEKTTDGGLQKIEESIKDLQAFQRDDMSEIRVELRALNSRIDEVIREKKPAQYAIWESL